MSYCGLSGLHFLLCLALYQMNFSKNTVLLVFSYFCLHENLYFFIITELSTGFFFYSVRMAHGEKKKKNP